MVRAQAFITMRSCRRPLMTSLRALRRAGQAERGRYVVRARRPPLKTEAPIHCIASSRAALGGSPIATEDWSGHDYTRTLECSGLAAANEFMWIIHLVSLQPDNHRPMLSSTA
jgi:hypothetical protein